MHIPDNYLSPATCAVLGAAMVPVWTAAVRKVRRELPKAGVPLLGIAAAFSFLVMMFPSREAARDTRSERRCLPSPWDRGRRACRFRSRSSCRL
jgi:hypothetical protein